MPWKETETVLLGLIGLLVTAMKTATSQFGKLVKSGWTLLASPPALAFNILLTVAFAGIVLKAILYPDFTWDHYFNWIEALWVGVGAGTVAVAAWVMKYALRIEVDKLADASLKLVFSALFRHILTVLLIVANVGTAIAIVVVSPRDQTKTLILFINQSDWQRAQLKLNEMIESGAFTSELLQSLQLYLTINQKSERLEFEDVSEMRGFAHSVSDLMERKIDPQLLNTLSYLEVTRQIYREMRDEAEIVEATGKIDQILRRSLSRHERSMVLRQQGSYFFAKKQYPVAVAILEEAKNLQDDPVLKARLFGLLGTALVSNGKLKEANDAYESARKHYPLGLRERLSANWAAVLFEMCDYKNAEELLKNAIKESKEGWLASLVLGTVLLAKNEFLDADKAFDAAFNNSADLEIRSVAMVLKGMTSELNHQPAEDWVPIYLESLSRSSVQHQVQQILANTDRLAGLYESMEQLIRRSKLHGTEAYLAWLSARSQSLRAGAPIDALPSARILEPKCQSRASGN